MKNKALFLDRDGVINCDKGYVHKQEDVEWVSGIFELMARFQQAGYLIIIVTNQSGIGRGFYSKDEFLSFNRWMNDVFAQRNIVISDTYFCPHHPTHAQKPYLTQCECRKPAPGMLVEAIQKWNISPDDSVMVGDSWTDIIAGVNAELSHCFYFSQSLTKEEKKQLPLLEAQSGTTIELSTDLEQIHPYLST